ncbi:MAG: penicillin-binding protein 2 [Patescibacteria group bacterium]|nr:penicillin-binding protein 2 [Patescibacteria group bacterium]
MSKKQNIAESQIQTRIVLVFLFVGLLGILIIGRLFSLQILQHQFYLALASETQEVYKNLFPQRGSIYVREKDQLYPLVTNRDYYLVYAEPVKVKDSAKIVDSLTPILDLKEDEWKSLLTSLNKTGDPYEPIKHKVTKPQVEQIESLNLEGIGFIPETFRFYPEKNIGGHIFGFVGFKDEEKVGQYGLEGYFNDELSGKSGLIKSVKDALGSLITIGPRSVQKAEDGVDLILTIDRQVQFTACQKLKEFYDWYQASSGTVIIANPKTGAIVAMCSFPDFDPEFYNEVEDINYFNNPAIFGAYEPGSVFKTITMGAALNEGKITPETTYEDTGELKVGPYKITNFDNKAYGQQTMTQALSQSLNLGAAFAAQQIGGSTLADYVKRFGFGTNTGIELNTEVPGNIDNLDRRGDVYYFTASYGHGITVTPLQLVAAYGAIANNGRLMKPYIVGEKIYSNGRVEITQPQFVRQVIENKTATILTGMLTQVVESSYDKKARVPNYYLAAKTGTALIPGSGGGYSNQTIHTIVGFGPVSDPSFVILIKIDKIKRGPAYASDSVGPLFSQLSQFLLNYYQIPPDY